MRRPVGRPTRYKHILEALDEDSLYSPSMIAEFAEKEGLLRTDSKDPEARVKAKLRIRITMGRLSNNHQFPKGGDGPVTLPGQRPYAGWYGWRWKITLYEKVHAPSDKEIKPGSVEKGVENDWETGLERHQRTFSDRGSSAKRRQPSPSKGGAASGILTKKSDWPPKGRPTKGRPTKYGEVLLALEDEVLYTPATICANAEEKGILKSDPSDADARAVEKRRIRTALIRKKAIYRFPALGDGQITFKGQAYQPAWYGRRWKSSLGRRVSDKNPKNDSS